MMRCSKSTIILSALLCVMLIGVATAEVTNNRKLLQGLRAPWLRIPAYDGINPARFLSGITQRAVDLISYGVLGDYISPFTDSAFATLTGGIDNLGR